MASAAMSEPEHRRLIDWLALAQAPGVGPRTVAALIGRFGDARGVRAAGTDALRAAGLAMDAIRAIDDPDQAQIDAALAWAGEADTEILTLEDPRYPSLQIGRAHV